MHATAPVTDRAEEPAAADAAPQRRARGQPDARAAADDRQPRGRAAARAPGGGGAAGAAGRGRARPELRQGAKDANYGYTQHRGAPDEPTRISDPTGGGDVELLQLKLNWHLSAMRRRGLIVDGDFGGATAKAVIAFKRFHKMRPANAVVDSRDVDGARHGPAGRRAHRPQRAGPGARVRPHHGGRPAPDHARGRLRRARPDRRRAPRAAPRARGGARLHARSRRARRSCTTRPGARRPPRVASCSSRRTWRPRSAAPSTSCCG